MFIHAAALTPMIGAALAARLSWETEVVLVAAPLFTVELLYVRPVLALMRFGLSLLFILDDKKLSFRGRPRRISGLLSAEN